MQTYEDLTIGDLHGIRTQIVGGWTGEHRAGSHIEARTMPRTLEHTWFHQITAGNREITVRTAIVHRVHRVFVAHQAHPPTVTHHHAQRQSDVDVTQRRRTDEPCGHTHASILTEGTGSVGPSSSAALSVCHANDAHFTRTGKRDTPENTTSGPRSFPPLASCPSTSAWNR